MVVHFVTHKKLKTKTKMRRKGGQKTSRGILYFLLSLQTTLHGSGGWYCCRRWQLVKADSIPRLIFQLDCNCAPLFVHQLTDITRLVESNRLQCHCLSSRLCAFDSEMKWWRSTISFRVPTTKISRFRHSIPLNFISNSQCEICCDYSIPLPSCLFDNHMRMKILFWNLN